MQQKDSAVTQLEEVLQDFAELRSRSQSDYLEDIPGADLIRFVTRARAAIHRVAGKTSIYVDQCEEIMKGYQNLWALNLSGVLESLRTDVSHGYLTSQTELIHGELFADFLDMAQHLMDEGYKDAAAVVAGSSLEAHMRQLCQKSSIPIEAPSGADVRPLKADRLNADLAKATIYGKLDQKNVTAWLDLRNEAAHGNYGKYEAGQVRLLISGIRDFLTRNPA